MAVNQIHKGSTPLLYATIKEESLTADGVPTLTAVDISGFTTKNFYLKLPNGSATTLAASFGSTGSDGVMVFTSTAFSASGTGATFPTTGTYELQGVVGNGSTTVHHTDIYKFRVFDNLV